MQNTKTLKVPPVLQLRHIRNVGSASISLYEVAVNKALQTLQKSLNLPMLLTTVVFKLGNRKNHQHIL
jgi:hypothetical protein